MSKTSRSTFGNLKAHGISGAPLPSGPLRVGHPRSVPFGQHALWMRPTSLLRVLFYLVLALPGGFVTPATVRADGTFVAPKFVWDKHKDINEPAQKAIIVYDAGHEDLILQVKYEGPVAEFGWLIPVPNLPTVEKGSMECFYELSQFTQRHFEPPYSFGKTQRITLGVNDGARNSEPPVKVIEIRTVGAYEVAVLSTRDSGALAKWLDANQFYFPTNKTEVLDDYVKRHWYFVAVKINLDRSEGFQLKSESTRGRKAAKAGDSTELKALAAGELYPLQISFASDCCVYPLKISSVNGQPSEVQVYVLSPEPLLETTMFRRKLPAIYIEGVLRAERVARDYKKMALERMQWWTRTEICAPPLTAQDENMIQKIIETPQASRADLLPFVKVTKADLPVCAKAISRLADKSWWLTKQTWTFPAEAMRDLEFGPGIPFLTGILETQYGHIAAANLLSLGADAVPVFAAALKNTNPAVRINAASVFKRGFGYFNNYRMIHDPGLTEAAITWLKDSEPAVRLSAVGILMDESNWNPKFSDILVGLLRDQDARVRHEAVYGLWLQPVNREYLSVSQEMLKDTNPAVQTSGLEMLDHFAAPIPREELLPFFKFPDRWAVDLLPPQLYDKQISNEEAIPLLQNPESHARLIGLWILYRNANKQSVELALPLLRDPDELVREKATQALHALTGQPFTKDQPGQWEKWWNENQATFMVKLHPEELWPQHQVTNDFRRDFSTSRPPVSAENLPRQGKETGTTR